MPRLIRLFCLTLGLGLAAHAPVLGQIHSYWASCPDFTSEEKQLVRDVLDSLPQISLPHHIYQGLTLVEADSLTLSLRTSRLSSWTLKVLPRANAYSILAVITSVDEPIADSQIAFYTNTWVHYDRPQLMTPPSSSDFLRGHPEAPRLRKLLSPLYLRFRWLNDRELSATLSMPTILDDQTREQDQALLQAIAPLRYRWDGQRLTLILDR